MLKLSCTMFRLKFSNVFVLTFILPALLICVASSFQVQATFDASHVADVLTLTDIIRCASQALSSFNSDVVIAENDNCMLIVGKDVNMHVTKGGEYLIRKTGFIGVFNGFIMVNNVYYGNQLFGYCDQRCVISVDVEPPESYDWFRLVVFESGTLSNISYHRPLNVTLLPAAKEIQLYKYTPGEGWAILMAESWLPPKFGTLTIRVDITAERIRIYVSSLEGNSYYTHHAPVNFDLFKRMVQVSSGPDSGTFVAKG